MATNLTNNDPTRALFKAELEELFSVNIKIPDSLGFEYIEKFPNDDGYMVVDMMLESEYGLCRLLEHRRWQEIDFLTLSNQQAGGITFYYLSPEAYAYYLPAFLYNSSRQEVYDSGSLLRDFFLYSLESDRESYSKFFSNPKPHERIAIYKYLQFEFEMDGTDFDFWPKLNIWDLD